MAARQRKKAFVIRDARSGDVPTLVDFMAKLALHVAGSSPLTLKTSEQVRLEEVLYEALEAPDKRVVVAEDPRKGLVGMGDICIWTSPGIWEQAHEQESRAGMIDNIWVEPDFRQSGIFKALLRALVEFAGSQGVHELIVEYAASNREAGAVWTRLGFEATGVRAAAYTHHLQEFLS